MAALLGKPFMPWQQDVADVVMEVDPVTGRLAYQELGLTVPRQSGKSTWIEAKSAHRCSATGFFGRRQHVVYTAQTRLKAREKWEEDFLADLLAARDFRHRIRAHLANGSEHVRFANGSRFALEAATEKSGHGSTIDEAYLDEAFAHQDWRLEQAFGPAMITRANKLLAWISTAGWLDGSPYLEEKVALGRAAVRDGRQRGLAYFEWSAAEDADPGDEAVWWSCMPALGHTISVDAIRAEFEKARDAGKLNEFRRAYLNQWVPKDAPDEWPKFTAAAWRGCQDPLSQPAGPVALGFAVAPDGSAAAIAAGGRRADGLGHGELTGPPQSGTAWLLPRLLELAEKHQPCVLVMNSVGEARAFEKSLIERGFSTKREPGKRLLQIVGASEYAAACAALANDVKNQGWRHLGQPQLDDSARSAGVRPLGSAWAWADALALEAVTLARHGFMTHGTAAAAFFGAWR